MRKSRNVYDVSSFSVMLQLNSENKYLVDAQNE